MRVDLKAFKTCVVYIGLLILCTSCVIEEEQKVNDKTGLEWTLKKYRNGDVSINVGRETIKAHDVGYFAKEENLFEIVKDSTYIYSATETSLTKITAIPSREDADPILVALLKPNGSFLSSSRKKGSIYCSDKGDFWIRNRYYLNFSDETFDLYHSSGKYITTASSCMAIRHDNMYSKHIDWFMVKQRFGEGDKSIEKTGVYDVNGNLLAPIVYYRVFSAYFDYADEVNNQYTFIAVKGKPTKHRKFAPVNSFDIYSTNGELLLSLDLDKKIYVIDGKQKTISDNSWNIEYDDSESEECSEASENLDNGTFKGYHAAPMNTDKYYDSYFLTRINNAFVIVHRCGHYCIKSLRIPISSTGNAAQANSNLVSPVSLGGYHDSTPLSVNQTLNNGGNLPNKPQKQTVARTVREDCKRCGGKKRIVHNTHTPMFGMNDEKVRCPECGEYHLRSMGHTHIDCPECNGRGYKERTTYTYE